MGVHRTDRMLTYLIREGVISEQSNIIFSGQCRAPDHYTDRQRIYRKSMKQNEVFKTENSYCSECIYRVYCFYENCCHNRMLYIRWKMSAERMCIPR